MVSLAREGVVGLGRVGLGCAFAVCGEGGSVAARHLT